MLSVNLFISAPPLPAKIMSVRKSSVGSFLISYRVGDTSLEQQNLSAKVFIRKSISPEKFGYDFRIGIYSNNELYELLNHMDVVQLLKNQLLRWLGHVIRIKKDVPAKRIFETGNRGSRSRLRHCLEMLN